MAPIPLHPLRHPPHHDQLPPPRQCQPLRRSRYIHNNQVYFIAHQSKHPPSGFKTACSAAGFTNMFGSTIALYYNTFFCAALGYSIANTLRKPFLDRIKLHILAFVTAISAVFVVIYTQNAGAPLKGICIYRSASQSSLGLFFLHIIVFVAVLYAIRKFRAQIPKNSYF